MKEKKEFGKKTFAREFAYYIIKNDFNKDTITENDILNLQDYIEVKKDENTIKIDQIREVQERIAIKPVNSENMVLLIDDADSLTIESQNALLKTLEEPPKYVTIILVVSDIQKLLDTIKSRCIKISFNDLSKEELKEYIKNNKACKTDDIDLILKLLDGSLKNYEKIDEIVEIYKSLENIVTKIRSKNFVQVFSQRNLLYSYKNDINYVLELFNIIFFENRMLECIDVVEKTKAKLLANNNFEMCMDYLLINCYEKYGTI